MVKIGKSKPSKPPRAMIYGVEGIGKSTFGARSESPIFLSPEGGVDYLTDRNGNKLDVFDDITSWDSAREAVKHLLTTKHDYKTLVIDSADWLEKLAHAKIIGKSDKDIVRINGGWGAGFRESEKMHKELIADLSELREKGMAIIITGHANVKPQKDPSMLHDYDAYELKCHNYVSDMWREWVDALFFARYRTFVKAAEDERSRARALSDGTRVVYTQKQPSFQAKNRYGMAPEYDFNLDFYDVFMSHVRRGAVEETKDQILDEIETLAKKVDETTLNRMTEYLKKADGNISMLKEARDRLRSITGEKQ